mmetsp:Transcript_17912/g.45987  ORF Transcript_17912/g.45987 Transcript_17912/m.45987 type:complete len:217 (+) Transcript_17912:332-982(+)
MSRCLLDSSSSCCASCCNTEMNLPLVSSTWTSLRLIRSSSAARSSIFSFNMSNSSEESVLVSTVFCWRPDFRFTWDFLLLLARGPRVSSFVHWEFMVSTYAKWATVRDWRMNVIRTFCTSSQTAALKAYRTNAFRKIFCSSGYRSSTLHKSLRFSTSTSTKLRATDCSKSKNSKVFNSSWSCPQTVPAFSSSPFRNTNPVRSTYKAHGVPNFSSRK